MSGMNEKGTGRDGGGGGCRGLDWVIAPGSTNFRS